MKLDIPKTDFYYVGLHKTGSTFIGTRLLPLFDDAGLRLHDHAQLGSFFEWRGPRGPAALFMNNNLSGAPDAGNKNGAAAICAVNPNAKIIVSIRSQSTMPRSLYWLCVKTGDGRRFERFVNDIIANGKLDYAALVEGYHGVFGKDNVLVLLYEEVAATPQATVERLARFFGVAAPTLQDHQTAPLKVTPGDLEIAARRWLNDRAARRGNERPHLANGFLNRTLMAAAHWGDLAYARLTDRGMTLIRLRDQDRRLLAAYGESNRRLFASLYDSPFASLYPGMDQATGQAQADAAATAREAVS